MDCDSVVAHGPQRTRATQALSRIGPGAILEVADDGPDIGPLLAPNGHIIDGRMGADQPPPGAALHARSGDRIGLAVEPGGGSVLRPGSGDVPVGTRPADAHIVHADIACINGIIHTFNHVPVQ